MSYVPTLLALDYETALTDGTPSHEYYRDDFRAISLAVAWYGKDGTIRTAYYEGEEQIGGFLARSKGIPKVCHNLSFEYGVTKHRFPGYELDFVWDTARLAQVYDNGGNKFQTYEREVPNEYEGLDDIITAKFYSGFSLVNSAGRILPEYQDHKAKFYSLIRSRTGSDGKVVKAGTEGANLHLLTPEELKEYATADAVTTLRLYTHITQYFERIGYDYTLDHTLYVPVARGVSDARSRGIHVNRDAVRAALVEIQAEIAAIRDTFLTKYRTEISQIETENQNVGLAGYKTQKGKDAYLARADWGFNVGSTTQLKRLFVDILGIKPTFWTEPGKAHKDKLKRGEEVDFTPKPSFKAAHLETYGGGGKLLINYKKKRLVERQLKSLLELSEKDSRWHLTLKAVGTSTGRMAGGN
jgi:hypothetical protein